MGLWHVNDAREPCLTSIFMNNCVRGAVEMGGGGGTAARPPKVSRAQSLDGGAAEALSSHACRHWPTCSSRLVAFPERRSMLLEEQRNNMLRSGYLMCSCQTLTSHCGCWYTDYRLQNSWQNRRLQIINVSENRDKPGLWMIHRLDYCYYLDGFWHQITANMYFPRLAAVLVTRGSGLLYAALNRAAGSTMCVDKKSLSAPFPTGNPVSLAA